MNIPSNNDQFDDYDDYTVNILFEDGTEKEYIPLYIFSIEEYDHDFIALALDDYGETPQDDEFLIYRYYDRDNFENIESEEEYEAAWESFWEIYSNDYDDIEEDYDFIYEDDDE